MTRYQKICIAWVATHLLVVGCAAKRPVLYPNTALQREGRQRAQAEISACLAAAESREIDDEAGSASEDGPAAGPSGSQTLFDWDGPDALTRQHVETCLTTQGYQVIGWR